MKITIRLSWLIVALVSTGACNNLTGPSSSPVMPPSVPSDVTVNRVTPGPVRPIVINPPGDARRCTTCGVQ